MINLSYRYDQNSSSLVVGGMPDVSNGDSQQTIGILSTWTLKIIGSPLLEGKKEHLDNLMLVILKYSRSYISGIRRTIKSANNVVSISPQGANHKLILNSTQKDVKPLEIIIDDSELSDLTRCLDLLRLDHRINLKWTYLIDKPFSKRYLQIYLNKSNNYTQIIFSFIIFIISSSLLFLIPVDNKYETINDYKNIPISTDK